LPVSSVAAIESAAETVVRSKRCKVVATTKKLTMARQIEVPKKSDTIM
jgi:hypothetical protein